MTAAQALPRTQTKNGLIADPRRGQRRIPAILKLQNGISTKERSRFSVRQATIKN